MDVEQKLKEIFRLRVLQDKVLLFRSYNAIVYGKNIKESLKKDLQNLINADIKLEQIEIRLPGQNMVPPMNLENLEPVNINKIFMDEKRTMEALNMLDLK